MHQEVYSYNKQKNGRKLPKQKTVLGVSIQLVLRSSSPTYTNAVDWTFKTNCRSLKPDSVLWVEIPSFSFPRRMGFFFFFGVRWISAVLTTPHFDVLASLVTACAAAVSMAQLAKWWNPFPKLKSPLFGPTAISFSLCPEVDFFFLLRFENEPWRSGRTWGRQKVNVTSNSVIKLSVLARHKNEGAGVESTVLEERRAGSMVNVCPEWQIVLTMPRRIPLMFLLCRGEIDLSDSISPE